MAKEPPCPPGLQPASENLGDLPPPLLEGGLELAGRDQRGHPSPAPLEVREGDILSPDPPAHF